MVHQPLDSNKVSILLGLRSWSGASAQRLKPRFIFPFSGRTKVEPFRVTKVYGIGEIALFIR